MSAAYAARLRLLLDAAISATRDIAEAHPEARGLVGGALWEAQGALNSAFAMQAERDPLPGDANVPPVVVGDEVPPQHPIGCGCGDCAGERAAGERGPATI